MSRKPAPLKRPTHRLQKGETIFALVYCGHARPGVTLLSTGETQRSASFLLDCDLLMGRWQSGLRYLFGADADHIPSDATLEPIP